MSSATEKILQEALALPVEEFRELIDALLDAIPVESGPEWQAVWREEVLRRIEQVRSGEIGTETWSEVQDQIRLALHG